MTRVDDNRETQRLQEERLLRERKESDKADGRKFEQTMAQTGRVQVKTESHQGGERQVQQHGQQQTRQKGFVDHMAAKFQQVNRELDQRLGKTKESDRKSDLTEQRDKFGETSDKKTEARMQTGDRLAAIQRDERQGGGGAGGGGPGSGMGRGGEASAQAASEAAAAAAAAKGGQATSGPQASEAPAGAAPVRIPPELLEKLVENVRVGYSAEGLAQFQFELKDQTLAGARFTVTCRDGKVTLSVSTGDQNIRRLLQASEGQLARAMDHKGMRLEALVIDRPA